MIHADAAAIRALPPASPLPYVEAVRDVVELPRIRSMLRHALPHLIEGTLVPVIVFYAVLWAADVWWALLGALLWSYAMVIRRLVTGQRVGGVLLVTAVTLTVRTVISVMSGSVIVYFLQPAAAKVGLALALLISIRGSEPLMQRLAGDWLPRKDELLRHAHIRSWFTRITVLWALLLLAHAGLGLWLLLTTPVETYVLVKTVLNVVVKGGAILVTIWWFRRLLRSHGTKVVFT